MTSPAATLATILTRPVRGITIGDLFGLAGLAEAERAPPAVRRRANELCAAALAADPDAAAVIERMAALAADPDAAAVIGRMAARAAARPEPAPEPSPAARPEPAPVPKAEPDPAARIADLAWQVAELKARLYLETTRPTTPALYVRAFATSITITIQVPAGPVRTPEGA